MLKCCFAQRRRVSGNDMYRFLLLQKNPKKTLCISGKKTLIGHKVPPFYQSKAGKISRDSIK